VIAQYAPDGARQAWYTQSLARIDEVLNVANESGKFWYQADALGSVYGLTNQAGALIGSQNYDVFGAPTPAPSGPAGQPFGFTGREHELDSGLVYARARYLNPSTGRWGAVDRMGMVDGPNVYAYVRADPVNGRDPSGHMRLGKSWDNPDLPHVKQRVQEALDFLRASPDARPVRCFMKYWGNDPNLNPFLEDANDIVIEWSSWDEYDFGGHDAHTDWVPWGKKVIYIDRMFPGGYRGDYDHMQSIVTLAGTIAHETVHNVFHERLEGAPLYVEGLLMSTTSPFHMATDCCNIGLTWVQELKIKFTGRL
jgi:RHS repeat-associated protein